MLASPIQGNTSPLSLYQRGSDCLESRKPQSFLRSYSSPATSQDQVRTALRRWASYKNKIKKWLGVCVENKLYHTIEFSIPGCSNRAGCVKSLKCCRKIWGKHASCYAFWFHATITKNTGRYCFVCNGNNKSQLRWHLSIARKNGVRKTARKSESGFSDTSVSCKFDNVSDCLITPIIFLLAVKSGSRVCKAREKPCVKLRRKWMFYWDREPSVSRSASFRSWHFTIPLANYHVFQLRVNKNFIFQRGFWVMKNNRFFFGHYFGGFEVS